MGYAAPPDVPAILDELSERQAAVFSLQVDCAEIGEKLRAFSAQSPVLDPVAEADRYRLGNYLQQDAEWLTECSDQLGAIVRRLRFEAGDLTGDALMETDAKWMPVGALDIYVVSDFAALMCAACDRDIPAAGNHLHAIGRDIDTLAGAATSQAS